jgi:RNA 2',3'-cyclic 3'-phosphodiesterase
MGLHDQMTNESTKKRRIFVAIKISETLQQEISAWEEEPLREPAFDNPSMNAIRWLRGKNLHVTIIPPWYERDIRPAAAALKTLSSRIQPFAVQFRAVTYGPDPRRPRLIWASGETPRELAELKTLAERALQKQPEARPLRLHLTLARFRTEDFSRFKIKELNEKISWREEIRSVALMEAHLSPAGADYEILEEFDLWVSQK